MPVIGESSDRRNWWRDAVIYQIYVRSFADGNGDGVGDLAGIRGKLGYLSDLGVDALWLTPFFPSPMADFGYDVSNYRDVDPVFGDLAEARALVDDAHRHELRLLVDLVPNHTSEEHEWFVAALNDVPGGPARDRYIFRDGVAGGPPNDWESVFGGSAWTRVPDGQWYLHLFAPQQPDLNWHHPDVRAEFESILRFWLDLGVDGFRVDVAHGMIKAAGLPDAGFADQSRMLGKSGRSLPYFDQDGVHEIHRSWRKLLDSYPGERIEVVEAWAPDPERLAAYVREDEAQQAFNFHYVTAGWEAAALRAVITESLHTAGTVGAPTTWVLSNHDMRRHPTRYGGGSLGLRRARAAALLTLALPGSAYVYQGEELGLPEVLDLPGDVCRDPQRLRDPGSGRDGCRVPIPWQEAGPDFGFGVISPATSWLPAPDWWGSYSVAAERDDPGSTLSLYRDALRIRRSEPGLGDGDMAWLPAGGEVLSFTRPGRFCCVVNLSARPVELPAHEAVLLASAPIEGDLLPADTAAWLRTVDVAVER